MCGGDGLSCRYYIPVWSEYSENPYNPHTIGITSAVIDGLDLESGDEIGVFDGDICVGTGIVEGTISNSNILSIQTSSASGDFPGFSEGNEISYRIWDDSESSEIIDVSSEYLQGYGIFSQLASSYVRLSVTFSTDDTSIADGCDLPDSATTGYLHLTADGSVLYNSPAAIGGSEFNVEGANVSSD